MMEDGQIPVLLKDEKVSLVHELLEVLRKPPRVGSLKLSWRDGKLCGVETIRQTY